MPFGSFERIFNDACRRSGSRASFALWWWLGNSGFLQIGHIFMDHCPDCRGFIFRPGPCGGLSQNIECVGCGSRFNVSHWRGQLVSWERIPNDSEWREDMFPKVLQ